MGDSLAGLDLHDELVVSGSRSARADACTPEGTGGSQRDGVTDSSYDHFFDATEDAMPEEAPPAASAQQLPPSNSPGFSPFAQRDTDEVNISDASHGPHTAVAQLQGALSSPGTPLAVDSPVYGLSTAGAAAAAAAAAPNAAAPSLGSSETAAGPAAGAALATASSVGLSVRSSVTFPSLAELASPVTPDFATQVRRAGAGAAVVAAALRSLTVCSFCGCIADEHP